MPRPTIDIDQHSYKHRFDASSLLTSKANKMLDASVVQEKKKNRAYVAGENADEFVDVARVLAAIAYFDMALTLIRPFDPNYSTVANWKCNALRSIGQYADAVVWYEEIVRIDEERNGGTSSDDPTAQLARKQATKLRGKVNAPLDSGINDADDFLAPPFTLWAQSCLRDMASGKYKDAALHFNAKGRTQYSAKALQAEWSNLLGQANSADLSIALEEYRFEWPGKSKAEIGWCYFSVSGPDLNEGIAFVVAQGADGNEEVCSVEFGRP